MSPPTASARRATVLVVDDQETNVKVVGSLLDALGFDIVPALSGEQALKRGPKLGWASDALFDIQCRQADWPGAIVTLTAARRNELVSRKDAERRRAVLLTAQAIELEDKDPARAETLACEAHDLAPDLVPAAEVAGRLLAARGKMQKSTTTVEQTWKRVPHPDLAMIHAYARTGDSPRDRLQRVRKLAALTPGNREGVIAVANAAIEARSWSEARAALEPLLSDGLSARICVLMARIEGGEKGDSGRVREWLARAIHAPRDPVWVADSHVSDRWAPVSPLTGRLDAYEWKVAEELTEKVRGALLLEELAQFATRDDEDGRDRPGAIDRQRAGDAMPVAWTGPVRSSGDKDAIRPNALDSAAPPPAQPAAAQMEPETAAGSNDPVSLAAKRASRNSDPAKAGAFVDGRPKEPISPLAPQTSRPQGLAGDQAAGESSAARLTGPNASDGRTASVRKDGDVEFFVNPHAPDDPGPVSGQAARKAAS